MKEIHGGVCAPNGYTASGVVANIKSKKSDRKDCALIYSAEPASVAGVFTTNKVKAPPLSWTQGVCIRGAARAVFINSGNANACTGQQGLEDAQSTAEYISNGLNIPITEVGVLSTGVIGVPLPMDRIQAGVAGCIDTLTADGSPDAALAILTTDTVPKEYAVEVPLSSGTVKIGAIAKGAGMLNPNMATMIAVITTDATIGAETLRPLLKDTVDTTFNRLCVDNDTSTNDAVLVMANEQAGLPAIEPGTDDYKTFAEAFEQVCVYLSKELVKDGEGATKFVELKVNGAASDEDALKIARSIAQSQLCKTAFFGEDANWGRIAAAAGYSGADLAPERISIAIEGLEVMADGLPTDYQEMEAQSLMKHSELHIDVGVGDGPGKCTFWTSDLGYEYVRINADYRS